jgi:SAM-dependent methyltransferase
VAPDPNAVYALGSSKGESARLQRQSDELAPESTALLDRVGLRPGASVIDIGCGPRGVIELLAERVLPGGRIVGLDSDPAHVEMASALVAQRGWDGVEIIRADARDTLTRPGGWVAGIEADMEIGICYPPHPAFDRLCELFLAAFSRDGANSLLGRRLGDLYRRAGLEEVTVRARAPIYDVGHSRRSIRADLVRAMHPQIVSLGLADQADLDELDREARAHFADPDTLVLSGLLFMAWGRKPLAA